MLFCQASCTCVEMLSDAAGSNNLSRGQTRLLERLLMGTGMQELPANLVRFAGISSNLHGASQGLFLQHHSTHAKVTNFVGR